MRPGRNSPAIALVGSSILVMVLVVSILYIGREILIPPALAMLITFLHTPLVSRLERTCAHPPKSKESSWVRTRFRQLCLCGSATDF